MARTVDEIVTQIDAEIAARPSLADLVPNPSQTAFWKNFRYAIAVCIGIFEQLLDKFKADSEAKLENSGVGTMPWLRQKAFEFQYDATTPQITQLVNYVPKYPVVDASKRIVTVCALSFNTSRVIDMALAKGASPGQLSGPELIAIQDYFTAGGSNTGAGVGVGVAGVAIVCATYDPDLLFMEATIKYNGLYTSTIQANVISAIETYLINLGITGKFKTIDLIDAIQAVEGVNDIFINNLALRFATIGFGSKTYLIQADATLLTEHGTQAGYAIGETTASNTLSDKLTFTVG